MSVPKTDVVSAARRAREASRVTGTLATGVKNQVLLDLADELAAARQSVARESGADLDAAVGLAESKRRRLSLGEEGVDRLASGLRQLAHLPDPVGQVVDDRSVPSGLRVRRVRAPLGVVCMIYEARPGVTIDAFALCFKAGNACILKGGKEAARGNAALFQLVQRVLTRHALPPGCLVSISAIERDGLLELLRQDASIDLVIPRGGESLVQFVREHSRIPTIQHAKGVCHIYVDDAADLEAALSICVSAKVTAPATCNAAECVLVHERAAPEFVPRLVSAYHAAGVEVRGCAGACALVPGCVPARGDDYGREFLDLVVALRVVANIDEAIAHIHAHSSNHSEAILTKNRVRGEEFCARVQSSCVLVNASTRFNDGFELGLGAEIGISTSKLHAYGPMGLEELTIKRFVVEGAGQTR